MTRTVAREISVQLGFGLADQPEDAGEALTRFFDREYFATLGAENALYSEYPDKKQLAYIETLVRGTAEHRDGLDVFIEKYAKGWKLTRISRIALAILRTALFELLYMDEVPDSVAINEAVELAKGYEEPETVAFINGILGAFMRGERCAEPTDAREAAAEADMPVPET
ncbi:MAG: transcription antitermination factor NusB [Oscillospiraceae bacterium]|jgi:N utilization substance protein B|nr:transcription antitermination factor NusB [Oscillospiraceae bacterium]